MWRRNMYHWIVYSHRDGVKFCKVLHLQAQTVCNVVPGIKNLFNYSFGMVQNEENNTFFYIDVANFIPDYGHSTIY